ncbi:hypothetical protein ACIQW7_00025 [Peribacillus simplex]|uniref:hypothetical protein n=1 Tax=Peribacillus TaxID=2675229 RepID=UPI00315A3F99
MKWYESSRKSAKWLNRLRPLDEELTVGDLLVLLFIDFLKGIKEKGNSSQAMKAILLNFEDYF